MHSNDSDSDVEFFKAVAKKNCRESMKEAIILNCNINSTVNVNF